MRSLLRNKITRYLKLLYFKRRWRKLNSHNETTIRSSFNSDLVTVGQKSYGEINIKFFSNPDEKVTIGNYVSIAENVTFILGGNHQTDTFTNFPLYSKYVQLSAERDAISKGPIIVEDEVWIGYGVTILSGVTIGKGAIIASCSVITKDVMPYSIVGGNPAKLIRMRFNNDITETLMNMSLNNYSENLIKENINIFYEPVEDAIKFLTSVNNKKKSE